MCQVKDEGFMCQQTKDAIKRQKLTQIPELKEKRSND